MTYKMADSRKKTGKGLEKAYDLASKGDYEAALALCDEFIRDQPDSLSGYRERAAVLLHKGEIQAAINDLQRLVDLGTFEPADFFDIGRSFVALGRYDEALESLDNALRFSEVHQDAYYVSVCRLLRAYSLLMLKRVDEAAREIAALEDGSSVYVRNHGLLTKEIMVARL